MHGAGPHQRALRDQDGDQRSARSRRAPPFAPRRWNAIAEDVKREFNERLRSKSLETSRWTVGANRVERLLGKELLVLAWAVEEADPSVYGNAVRNWIGLRPEERWWLYTMTAAATGNPQHTGIGRRKPLRFALTENPLADPMEGRTMKPRRSSGASRKVRTSPHRAFPLSTEKIPSSPPMVRVN